MRIEDLCKEVPETEAAELSFRPGKEADSSPVTPLECCVIRMRDTHVSQLKV